MKIAVTGGTGFVGRNLVDRLIAEGHTVTVLTHQQAGEPASSEAIHFVKGSVDDADSLQAAFENVETVYHLVGIIAETRTKTFQKTVVMGTANVVEAARRCGVRKLIYLSAMGTSENARSKYHRTKYLAEQTIAGSGVDYVIYRPSVIYGLDDGFVSMLAGMITASPITPIVGSGRYKLQPVYIDDVISAMVQGLTNERATNKIIELGGPDELEYLEIIGIIKRALERSTMNFHIPMWVMRIIASVSEIIMTPAPITRDQLIMMEMGNTGDISSMRELFSIDPVKFEEGLRKYLR